MLRKELLELDLGELEENDVNLTDVLFSVMQRPYKKERKRSKVLATLLIYGNVNVNARAPSGMASLHYAVQVSDNVHVTQLNPALHHLKLPDNAKS